MALPAGAVVVTRPLADARLLAEKIEARGGRALVMPLLHIEPLAPDALQAVARALPSYRFAVFVSHNAVAAACPLLLASGAWPKTLRAVALGPTTAAALARFGVTEVVTPTGPFDSETLLRHPALAPACVEGARVVIFRGNGGRELLANTLTARGAEVICVSCYQRRPPADLSPLFAALKAGQVAAITLTSSEALRHLLAHAANAPPALWQVPFFVPHQRIFDAARAAGLHTVVLTPPGDAGLIAAVEQYFSRP